MVDIPVAVWDYIGAPAEKTFEEVEKTVANSLDYMEKQADRMLEDYETYCKCDNDRTKDTLLFAMTARLNHIVQAFCDSMTFVEINEPDREPFEETLSYHIRQYEARDIASSVEEKKAVEFLKDRNSIVHDYLNSAKLNHDFLIAMASYGTGFPQIAKGIREYCFEHFSVELTGKKITDMKKSYERKQAENGEKPMATQGGPKRKR